MAAPVVAFIGLGANLGDMQAALRDAALRIAALPGTRILRESSLYRTEPVGAGGPDYLNSVLEVETALPPHELLAALQGIENAAGRERPYRHAPRTLDLDLLLYGNEHIATPTLTVPHPRMFERAFVLVPLAEIAPHRVPPGLLAQLAGQRIERVLPGG